MPVITLKVSTDTAVRLERLAARRHSSKSAVVRDALIDALRDAPDETSVHDLMKDSLGRLDSGVRDLGHHTRHLAGFGRI
jgi:predicted transcriptional regulator